jgi:hypothetical protein
MAREHDELIEHYAHGGEKLSMAIRGLTRDDMLWKPDDADAKQIGKVVDPAGRHPQRGQRPGLRRPPQAHDRRGQPHADRLRRKQVRGGLFYDDQPVEKAVQLLSLNRELLANVLRKLPEQSWSRKGTHNERGVLTVAGYLKSTVDHLEHHISFIHKKRAKMGKEMW